MTIRGPLIKALRKIPLKVINIILFINVDIAQTFLKEILSIWTFVLVLDIMAST